MGNIASKFNLLPVVLVLICVAAFIGCELSEPDLLVESSKDLGLSLIYPPEMEPDPNKALDDDDLLRAWLFQLGADEEAAFSQRPVVGDPSWVPVAYGEGPENRSLILNLASPIEGYFCRLFIDSEVLGGNTTFRLHPNELERVVNVVLAPKSVQQDRFSIYNGFVSSDLSEPTGAEPAPSTITYPVALENIQPLDGLYLRFVVEADSASILIDFGSRIYNGGGPELVGQEFERLVVADPNVVAYQLRIIADVNSDQEALLMPGNDILLYVVAHGDTSRSGICFDQENSLIFPAGESTAIHVDMVNPGDCVFPQVVDLTVVSPSDGQHFSNGEIIPIRWTMVGTPGPEAQIDLIHQGEVCWSIAQSTANDGAFDWHAVRCSESPGPYTIRITDLASGESSNSDGAFNFKLSVDEFLLISAGTFTMGSPDTELGHAENGSEEQHSVTLSEDFWLSPYEVSEELWRVVMGGFIPSVSFRPKTNVSWYQAILFCNRFSENQGLRPVYTIHGSGHVTWDSAANGYRLPTDAEWEYACRAGSTTAYANGEITNGGCSDLVLDVIGRYCGNGTDQSNVVGDFMPNTWGLFDMHGNAAEWCWDVYSGTLGFDPVTDPVEGGYEQNSDSPRVIRGGWWQSTAPDCRSAVRFSASPNNSSFNLGFRLARSARDEESEVK